MTRLKIPVEKAVRPIRASNRRKDRMRAELLAHITDIFEQERTRAKDEDEAVERTVRRFGDPAELTEQLQASVPVVERIGCTPIPLLGRLESVGRMRPGESPLHHTGRVAGYTFVLGLAVFCALPLLLAAGSHARNGALWRSDGEFALLAGLPLSVLVATAAFPIMLLGIPMRRALESRPGDPRSLRRAAGYGLLQGVLGFAATTGFWLILLPRSIWVTSSTLMLVGSVGVAITVPITQLLEMRESAGKERRHHEWESLEIDV